MSLFDTRPSGHSVTKSGIQPPATVTDNVNNTPRRKKARLAAESDAGKEEFTKLPIRRGSLSSVDSPRGGRHETRGEQTIVSLGGVVPPPQGPPASHITIAKHDDETVTSPKSTAAASKRKRPLSAHEKLERNLAKRDEEAAEVAIAEAMKRQSEASIARVVAESAETARQYTREPHDAVRVASGHPTSVASASDAGATASIPPPGGVATASITNEPNEPHVPLDPLV